MKETPTETRTDPSTEDFRRRVFVFTGATFEAALADWVDAQIGAYPRREELIRITALAMRDFLGSDQARDHKMIMKGKP